MPAPYKLTQAQEQDIARRYQEGESVSQLALEHDVTRATLRRVVRRQGGLIREVGGGRNYTPEEIQELATRWHAGESQTKIAESLGISQAVVSRILAAVPRPPQAVVHPQRGELNPHWKGGRVEGNGQVWIKVQPDHPMASMRNRQGYIPEHRLVMAEHLGRPLLSTETVHHINNSESDDNRIENLQLRQGKHGKGAVARCRCCGSVDIEFQKLED
jgi:transposase-like protein